jgi:homoserine kinase
MTQPTSVKASAPATVSNLGPGFDILGCAVEGASDTVVATLTGGNRIVVAESGHPDLPTDPTKHTAAIAAREVLLRAGRDGTGLELRVTKGTPLSGGQGGSAASAVAAAVAVNALLGSPLDEAELLAACLAAEEAVAGRHADNLAPALLGGLILVRTLDPVDLVRLPVPEQLRIVIAHPQQQMNTREARAVVPENFSRETLIHQSAQVGALVAGFALGDFRLIARALDDRVAEPFRAPLLRGFSEAKQAALRTGALGASISGSGPTSFALVEGDETAQRVATAMGDAYRAEGVECSARVSRVVEGARVEG